MVIFDGVQIPKCPNTKPKIEPVSPGTHSFRIQVGIPQTKFKLDGRKSNKPIPKKSNNQSELVRSR